MRKNNIDLELIKNSAYNAHSHGNSLAVEKIIEGTFNLEGSPMFSAQVKSDTTTTVLGCDEPRVLGGQGIQPTPLTYLLFGVISCYASTLAMQCAMDELKITELQVTGRLYYDLAPVVSDSDAPIIKKLQIEVRSNEYLGKEIEKAWKKCPAVYAIQNPIETEIYQKK